MFYVTPGLFCTHIIYNILKLLLDCEEVFEKELWFEFPPNLQKHAGLD